MTLSENMPVINRLRKKKRKTLMNWQPFH